MQPRTSNWETCAAKFLQLAFACTLTLLPLRADEPAPDLKLFTLPKPELRSAAPPESSGSAPASTADKSTISNEVEELSISSEVPTTTTELSIATFESMSGGPILSRVERYEPPGGALGWLNENVWDPVFSPEIVKFGKVQMSGGIVAAFKRKNPLCLLHPLVFVASW